MKGSSGPKWLSKIYYSRHKQQVNGYDKLIKYLNIYAFFMSVIMAYSLQSSRENR